MWTCYPQRKCVDKKQVTMTSNCTQEQLLSDVNREGAKKYYGFIAFAAILFLPAVIGNLHILHIYISKKKHNNTRVYVCFIAVLDMTNFVVCCPFYVVNCLYPFMFYSDAACKVFTLITYFVNICIPFSLLVISVDRFRVICRPFRAQISKKLSKLLCVLIATASFLLSLPTVILFGSVPIETGRDNLIGRECDLSASFGSWSVIYIAILSVMTFIEAIVLIVLYSFMAITIKRQQALLKNSGMDYTTSSRSKSKTLTKGKLKNCEMENEPRTSTSSVEAEQSSNIYTIAAESTNDADIVNISIVTESCSIETYNQVNTEGQTGTKVHLSSESPFASSDHLKHSRDRGERKVGLHRHISPVRNSIISSPTTNSNDSNPKQTKEANVSKQNMSGSASNMKEDESRSVTYERDFTNNTNLGTNFRSETDKCQRTKHTCNRKSTINRHENGKEKFMRTKRVTIMFFWITFIYIVSFLPNPALRVMRYFRPDWYTNVGFTGQLIYHLLISTIFIASATNFFVYIFCDSSFRKQVHDGYKNLLRNCSRKTCSILK